VAFPTDSPVRGVTVLSLYPIVGSGIGGGDDSWVVHLSGGILDTLCCMSWQEG
jgi:hypothetical protein